MLFDSIPNTYVPKMIVSTHGPWMMQGISLTAVVAFVAVSCNIDFVLATTMQGCAPYMLNLREISFVSITFFIVIYSGSSVASRLDLLPLGFWVVLSLVLQQCGVDLHSRDSTEGVVEAFTASIVVKFSENMMPWNSTFEDSRSSMLF